jgi:F0F1-type ATP synthase membrane subunit c/vacuolar-type H+-ATPase subunit K
LFVRLAFGHRVGSYIRPPEREVIPDSFILILIVLAIPVIGLVAALVASRIPSRRSDS